MSKPSIEDFWSLSINEELCNFYRSIIRSLNVSETTKKKLSIPLLMQVSPGYMECLNRGVFIVGQETNGWGGGSIGHTYFSFAESNKNERIMMEAQSDFIINRYGRNPVKNSPFWEAVRNIAQISSDEEIAYQPYLWTNLMACDYEGGSFIGKMKGEEDAFIEFSKQKFIGEFKMLKPKVCILFTGPDYDFVIERFFDLPSNWKNVDIRSLKECGNTIEPSLVYVKTFVWNDCRFFRTYHPKYLRLKKMWQIVDSLSEIVKKMLN